MTRQRPTKYPGVFEDEETGRCGYVFWYRDPKDGTRKQRKRRGIAKLARDARDLRDEERRSITKGMYTPSRTTVAELFELDMELQLANGWLRSTTAEQYRRQFKLHVGPACGHMRAENLRSNHLDRLYGDMRKKGLASSTIRQTANMLSGVFKRAVKRGDLAENPCKRATHRRRTRTRRRHGRSLSCERFLRMTSCVLTWISRSGSCWPRRVSGGARRWLSHGTTSTSTPVSFMCVATPSWSKARS
jgi:hypothetical protein